MKHTVMLIKGCRCDTHFFFFSSSQIYFYILMETDREFGLKRINLFVFIPEQHINVIA